MTVASAPLRSEEHTSELQSQFHLVCRLLLENKKETRYPPAGSVHYCTVSRIMFRANLMYCVSCCSTCICEVPPLYQESECKNLFFFNDTATPEIYTLSLHDALPILRRSGGPRRRAHVGSAGQRALVEPAQDRKSTRLNSSHSSTSYAVFCLKKTKAAPVLVHRRNGRRQHRPDRAWLGPG